jgi:acylphosphatase
MARAKVMISGDVQGVAFRARTREMALRLGVSGWVRNTPDGRVEAIFEGSTEDVQAIVQWCHTGPPA